jgi:hypothetical protein
VDKAIPHVGETAAAPNTPQPRHDPSDRIAQAPIRMKQTAHRRMIRGKLKPEARIDLHGMTLSEAHPALVDFVIRCPCAGPAPSACHHRQGAQRRPRRSRARSHPTRRAETAGSRLAHGAAAGPLVLEIREAHQRHGGGGAYYVYLRRPRQAPRSQHVTAEIRASRQFAEVLSTKSASTVTPSPARSGAVKLSSSNTRSITV